MNLIPKKFLCGLTFLLAAIGFNVKAHAQQSFVFPGLYGIESAVAPPPGVYFTAEFVSYNITSVKDGNGKDLLPNFNATAHAYAFGAFWLSPFKVLGAHYGLNVGVGLGSVSVEGLEFEGFPESDSSTGLADIFIVPLGLAWDWDRYHLAFLYGFNIPIGDFNPEEVIIFSFGGFIHEFDLGATVYLDKAKTWSITNWIHGEIHHKKKDEDLTIGPFFTWDWAIGKKFFDTLTVGPLGYAQWQILNNSGTSQFSNIGRERVYGIGGELGIAIPQIASQLNLRVIQEFGARNRGQGLNFQVNIYSRLWGPPPSSDSAKFGNKWF